MNIENLIDKTAQFTEWINSKVQTYQKVKKALKEEENLMAEPSPEPPKPDGDENT